MTTYYFKTCDDMLKNCLLKCTDIASLVSITRSMPEAVVITSEQLSEYDFNNLQNFMNDHGYIFDRME